MMKKKVILLFVILFALGLTYFIGSYFTSWSVIDINTKTLFDDGNYTYTFYNTSGFIQLNVSNISGNYTKNPIYITDFSQWNTISWLSNCGEIPYNSNIAINISDNILLLHMNEGSGNLYSNTSYGRINTTWAIPHNNPTYGLRGKLNNSVGFDGIDNYFEIYTGSISSYGIDLEDRYSISAWFKTNVSDAGEIIGYNITELKDWIYLDSEFPTAKILGNDSSNGLGYSVASGDINGDGYDDIIVGAPDITQHDPGNVYVLFGSSGNFSADLNAVSANITLTGAASGDSFGYSVASGDINGDGYDDIIVGAPYVDTAEIDAGSAYVFFGTIGEFNVDLSNAEVANITLEGADSAKDHFGWTVASGDINGDGYGDILAGAPNASTNYGVVNAFFGTNDQFSVDLGTLSANITLTGPKELNYAHMGYSIASGDTNNDGYDDILTGAPYNNEKGNVYVFFGTNDEFSVDLSGAGVIANMTINGTSTNSYFGYSVATGDINNDSKSDIIAGVPGYANLGRIDAFFSPGTHNYRTEGPNISITGGTLSTSFGLSVSSGDFNNDGYYDLLAGAPVGEAGRTYIMYGGPNDFSYNLDSGLNRRYANTTIVGDDTDDKSGYSVASADFDNDGILDIIVGAPYADPVGGSNAGEVYAIEPLNYTDWIRLYIQNGTLKSGLGMNNSINLSCYSLVNDSNYWHHALLVVNGSDNMSYLYLDGILESSQSYSFFDTRNRKNLFIGALNHVTSSTISSYFNGTLDELAIFNRSLDDAEALALWRRGINVLNLSYMTCTDLLCTGRLWVETNSISPVTISIDAGNKYLKYKFEFFTENKTYTPKLYNVSIDYTLPTMHSCGDGICNSTETCTTCWRDCGQCMPMGPGIITETESELGTEITPELPGGGIIGEFSRYDLGTSVSNVSIQLEENSMEIMINNLYRFLGFRKNGRSGFVFDLSPKVYAAHCYSGDQDYDETETDCGGECAPCIEISTSRGMTFIVIQLIVEIILIATIVMMAIKERGGKIFVKPYMNAKTFDNNKSIKNKSAKVKKTKPRKSKLN